MKRNIIFKFSLIVAGFVALPVLSGILIGKVSESLLAQSDVANLSSPLESKKETEPQKIIPIATSSSESPSTEPNTKPSPPPAVAAAVTKQLSTSDAKNIEPIARLANCSGGLSEKFLCLLNDYREKKGLRKVELNTSLSKVALGHSTWMDQTGTFSHTGVGGSRLTERCAAAGIRCLAENLAMEIYSADGLLSSWIANPSHNKNLLGPYTIVGLGVSGDYVTLLLN